uniref:Uncharacterized protein n=1 Tax=Zea mays TaxID=4577 RepID=B4FIN7_MAIZE|nr:unknown [Zea mays]ACR37066.1 unknown [Zea mays]
MLEISGYGWSSCGKGAARRIFTYFLYIFPAGFCASLCSCTHVTNQNIS